MQLYCPVCNCLKNSTESSSVIPIVLEDGGRQYKTYFNYYCEECGVFLRSEEQKSEFKRSTEEIKPGV